MLQTSLEVAEIGILLVPRDEKHRFMCGNRCAKNRSDRHYGAIELRRHEGAELTMTDVLEDRHRQEAHPNDRDPPERQREGQREGHPHHPKRIGNEVRVKPKVLWRPSRVLTQQLHGGAAIGALPRKGPRRVPPFHAHPCRVCAQQRRPGVIELPPEVGIRSIVEALVEPSGGIESRAPKPHVGSDSNEHRSVAVEIV